MSYLMDSGLKSYELTATKPTTLLRYKQQTG